MHNIPFLDLHQQHRLLKKEVERRILKVVSTQQFILGEETASFERHFARYCGKRYAVGLGSGTDALLVALLIIGLQPGDEVLVPAFTFISPAEVVRLAGGKVVFCDVDPQTGLLDLDDVQRRITRRTRLIVPVHLFGQIAPIQGLIHLVTDRNIAIIEDAAQAHGATYKNRMAPLTTIATYSFYPAKNLGAFGDAGAIVTDSKRVYEKANVLRNHGQKEGEKYHHRSIGFNFRMDEIQAAVLNVKLRHLNRWVRTRRRLAERYDRMLRDLPAIRILKTLPGNKHSYHLYGIRTPQRDRLRTFLEERGIQTRVHYPRPLHLQPAFKDFGYKRGDFSGAELLSREILCLPLYPGLSNKALTSVVLTIKQFFTKAH